MKLWFMHFFFTVSPSRAGGGGAEPSVTKTFPEAGGAYCWFPVWPCVLPCVHHNTLCLVFFAVMLMKWFESFL